MSDACFVGSQGGARQPPYLGMITSQNSIADKLLCGSLSPIPDPGPTCVSVWGLRSLRIIHPQCIGPMGMGKNIDFLGIFFSLCVLHIMLLALVLGEIKALNLIPTKKPFLGFSNKEVGKVSVNQFAGGYFGGNKSIKVSRMSSILKTKRHDVSLLSGTLYISLTGVPLGHQH